jgi:type IV secretory pathway VirB2 component (pilin)
MRKNLIFSYILFVVIFFLDTNKAFAYGCGADANPALRVLCEVIIFLQGRIGRAFASITIVVAAWEFTTGGIKWQSIATLLVGFGLFWFPKTMALSVLPDYIDGISGFGINADEKHTPDQILTCICPELN